MRLFFGFLLCTQFACAQELNIKGNQGGMFSLGVRTTISTFNHGDFNNNGMGVGGQFRLQFADRVNSDWFFDYIRGNVGDFASRTDYHIGWSVLFYYLKNPALRIRPYILAGHCFDYTNIVDNSNAANFAERWSSAVQAGTGVHFNLSQRLDLSVVGQYMIHLGNHLEAHKMGNSVSFHEHGGGSLEGHLLFHVGINYKIGDLW
ncbi:MAG: hypothetical protein V4638_05235 [Bacteroidota bacterium]